MTVGGQNVEMTIFSVLFHMTSLNVNTWLLIRNIVTVALAHSDAKLCFNGAGGELCPGNVTCGCSIQNISRYRDEATI